MKIGIYGDSYASSFRGWPEYIQHFYKASEVDLFGVGGSSINYSYMKFLSTHKKYDLVIFLWTSPTRNSLITKNPKKKKFEIHGFTENVKLDTKNNLRENLIFNYQKKKELNEFSDLDIQWVIYESKLTLKYPTKNFLEHLAMRDSVKMRRPDCISIDCFYNHEYDRPGLSDVWGSDWLQFFEGRLEDPGLDDPEIRPNHLTIKQNMDFAKYLYRHINQKDFDIHDTFVDPRKYYTMSKTFEESGFVRDE